MSSGLQLTASIKYVRFLPRDFVEIGGTVWSKHRGGLVVNDDFNRYNKRWFWHSDLPEPVAEVLTEVADAATIDLVHRKALPTFWPKGLMEEEQQYPFDMHFDHITIFNSAWDKDKLSEAQIEITSKHHLGEKFNPDNVIHSTVEFDEGWKLNDKLFKVLEENL
jgi:hypothetical protein